MMSLESQTVGSEETAVDFPNKCEQQDLNIIRKTGLLLHTRPSVSQCNNPRRD